MTRPFTRGVVGDTSNQSSLPVIRAQDVPVAFSLSLRQLHCLTVLARDRHFQKAAIVCNISQPSFSRHIARMEQTLSLKLINRTNAHFFGITPDGQVIVDHASSILKAAGKIGVVPVFNVAAHDVRLRDLLYLVIVSVTRQFSKAAFVMEIRESYRLTLQVRKIERVLSTSLFEKRRGKLVITPEGQRIVDGACVVLEKAARIGDGYPRWERLLQACERAKMQLVQRAKGRTLPDKQDGLKFELWHKCGFSHDQIHDFEQSAKDAGISLLVYLRESLGIELGRAPSVRTNSESPFFSDRALPEAGAIANSNGRYEARELMVAYDPDCLLAEATRLQERMETVYAGYDVFLTQFQCIGPGRVQEDGLPRAKFLFVFRVNPNREGEALQTWRYHIRKVRFRSFYEINRVLQLLQVELQEERTAELVNFIRVGKPIRGLKGVELMFLFRRRISRDGAVRRKTRHLRLIP